VLLFVFRNASFLFLVYIFVVTRCDIILASPTAKFGQPEINLGVIPGAGGTQRLTHAIGKSRAMELILTGRMFSAKEAEAWGLVSRVVGEGEGEVVKEAVKVAATIASKGRITVQAAKEAVDSGEHWSISLRDVAVLILCYAAYELPLKEGLRLERRLFHQLFATNDQKEGMSIQYPALCHQLTSYQRHGCVC
jgi:enoyl-CoA hydratase